MNPPGPGVNATFFLGPKEFDLLKSIDAELVRAIDYGMFACLVVPLLRALNWVNDYIGNYGWSIIALTFLINLAIFPLRHKSVVSMRKMQELQPEIKAIQERYGKLKATDPAKQKMNQELMELYKQRGVNPASGCVPMLLTMPILFAFYSMLAYSIELRGAPFGFWIKDLSVYDPFYVAPILTGITMLVQQKMTPQTATDPVQQKMFMLMPVIFTVMFLWAPSGLNIYWLVNNLLAIGQQYFTNRIIGPARVPRPAAERRLRRRATDRYEQRPQHPHRRVRDRRDHGHGPALAGGRHGDARRAARGSEGEGGEWLVRRRGEALNALQHIVAAVFRDSLPEGQRIAVDCLGFRQDKDAELRKMAQFLAEKAVTSGAPQEIGPLNPYERRIVHMAVAERADVTSESIGDAFMKTVIIAQSRGRGQGLGARSGSRRLSPRRPCPLLRLAPVA